jgi:hypothetical protein
VPKGRHDKAPPAKRRTPRAGAPAGRPRPKRNTRSVTDTGWTLEPFGIAWLPDERVLANCQQAVARVADIAALVQAVRHCQERGKPVPDWIVGWLERWLAEFLALVTPGKHHLEVRPPRIVTWGREYLRAWQDWWIADHLQRSQGQYGLTRDEALDEAWCYFRGTPLAGSPPTLKRAWQRARRRAQQGWLQRPPTSWEMQQLRPLLDPDFSAGSPREYWIIINGIDGHKAAASGTSARGASRTCHHLRSSVKRTG